MANKIPFINGVQYSWASISMNILGRTVTGVTAISYGDDQNKENIYGAGSQPIARGRGNIEPTASITLMQFEVEGIEDAVIPGRIQDIPPFDITVQYMDANGDVRTNIIRNAEFKNNGRDHSQGDTSSETQFELIVSHINWKGQTID